MCVCVTVCHCVSLCVTVCHCVQVLWAEEREEKGLTGRQSFVDLGCGNGLLVHILTNEGVSEVGSSDSDWFEWKV